MREDTEPNATIRRYRAWQVRWGLVAGDYRDLTGLGASFYILLWVIGLPLGLVALFTLARLVGAILGL